MQCYRPIYQLFVQSDMNMRCVKAVWLGILLVLALPCLATEVQVQGLFKGAAVLLVDGKQRMLKVGSRSPEGVLLVYADTKKATIEVDGKRHQLTLSKRIATQYERAPRSEVAIVRNATNQYITDANINGKRIKVLVDTGATAVALSSKDAKRLGIRYKKGKPSQAVTASGVAKAYEVTLERISLGAITVRNVSAMVIEGGFPVQVLLGMSYLNHVNIREQGGTMYLQSKY